MSSKWWIAGVHAAVIIAYLGLAGGPQALAETPPAWCRYAKSDTERAICRESRLWSFDNCQDGLFKSLSAKSSVAARRNLEQAERNWLKDRDNCGTHVACIESEYRKQIRALANNKDPGCPALAGLGEAGIGAEPNPLGQACFLDGAHPAIAEVRIAAANARVGEKVGLSWRIDAARNSGCRSALYLVIASRSKLRFSGDGFFALAAGAAGPFGARQNIDVTRLFIPLGQGEPSLDGMVDVMATSTGGQHLSWYLLEISALDTGTRAGTAAIPATTQRVGVAGHLGFDATPGAPRLVVQDRAFVGAPTRRVYSLDGQHELRVFEGFFEVVTTATGDIVARPQGYEPPRRDTSGGL